MAFGRGRSKSRKDVVAEASGEETVTTEVPEPHVAPAEESYGSANTYWPSGPAETPYTSPVSNYEERYSAPVKSSAVTESHDSGSNVEDVTPVLENDTEQTVENAEVSEETSEAPVNTASEEKTKQPRKPWTEEQRAAQRERMKEYWSKNEHPLKGSKLSEARKTAQREAMARKTQEPVLATCDRCGGPIRDAQYAQYALGSECLEKAIEAGEVKIEDGVRVDLAPLTVVSRARKVSETSTEEAPVDSVEQSVEVVTAE